MTVSRMSNPSESSSEAGADGRFCEQAPIHIDPEMVAFMRSRRRDTRRHQAQMAQISRHPDPAEAASGQAQQRIWALRQARQRRLKLSDLAMVRRSG